MARSIRLSDKAAEDLQAILTWQTQPGSGGPGRRRIQAILRAIAGLRRTPCLWPAGEWPGTRAFSVEGHRIVYQVIPDTGRNATAGDVFVVRVFGPGQSRNELPQ